MARRKPLPGDEARQSAGQTRTAAARKRRREATALERPGDTRILVSTWQQIASLRQAWQGLCHTTFHAMLICCLCGMVHLGYEQTWVTSMVALPDLSSPAAAANIPLYQHTQHNGMKIMCPPCQKHALRSRYLVYMEPNYIQQILSESHLTVQTLALLDVSMTLSRRMHGFVHGYSLTTSLLDYPLVHWSANAPRIVMSTVLKELLMYNMRTNPLILQFLTLLERPHPLHGVPIIGSEIVAAMVMDACNRATI